MTLGERQQFTQIDEPYTDKFLLGDFTLEADLGGPALTSITSLTNRDVNVVRDASALGGSVSFSPFGAPEAGYTLDFPLVDATTAKGLTQELRVAGDGERVDWVLGTFYSTSERQYGQSAYAENYVAVNGPAVTDFLRLVTGVPDLVWSGSRSLAGRPDTEELFFSDLDYDFDQTALFGEVSLALTDRFNLTGGLRWYDFEEERTQTFDAGRVHVQSGAARLQHPQRADRLAQRPLGRGVLRGQCDRRAGVPGAGPGAGDAGPGRLPDEPAAELRRQHAHRFLA